MPAHVRVYWNGPGNPLGKLHRAGIREFERHGWARAPLDADVLPAFWWSSRRAGDFPICGPGPLVRPLPHAYTDVVDDKFLLARLLAASRIDPPSCAGDDLAALDALPGPRVYVKHRRGVKGQSVRPLARDAALHWLSEQSPAQRANFVVQAEVPPALLPDGRRFVLRSHVLVIARARAPSAYVHRDVVVLPHAAPDSDGTQASHVSQAGRGHPPPTLLADAGAEHPAGSAWAQLPSLVYELLRAAAAELLPPPDAPRDEGSLLYSLLGLDLVVDRSGRLVLLEANSHPAIADGTMAAVPRSVYDNLVGGVLRLLVLPHLEDRAPDASGWERVKDGWAG